MERRSSQAISAIALLLFLTLPGTATAWQDALQGSAHGTDRAFAVLIDPVGDVVAVGGTNETTTGDDLMVVKVSGATGAEIWRHTVDGGLNVQDFGFGVAIDAEGNIAVAGVTNLAPTIPQYLGTGDFTVLKLDGHTGNEIWRYSRASQGGGASAVAFDSSGDVAAVGSVVVGGTGVSLQLFTIVRLAKDTGAELWHLSLDDGFPESAGVGVVTGQTGDVFAVGATTQADVRGAYFVTRRAAIDGSEVWTQRLQGDSPTLGPFEVAHAIELDGSGDVLTAGVHENVATGPDFVVAKLAASTGALLWSTTIDGGAIGSDRATEIAVTTSNDAVAAGWLVDAAGQKFAVVKLDGSTGGEVWRWTGAIGSANAVRVDSAGDVIAAGVLPDSISGSPRFGVVKLSGMDGAELWRRTMAGSSVHDEASALALTATGDVVAAGTTSAGGVPDFAVVELAGATGIPTDAGGAVCGNGMPEAGEECDDGNTGSCDGCSSGCRIEGCGNGVVECTEECDDGALNGSPGDHCSAICIEVPDLRIPGGGGRGTDCAYEWSLDIGQAAVDTRNVPRNAQDCTDNDPTCDSDPTAGSCRFRVWGCVGGADQRLSCSAVPVDGVGVKAPNANAKRPEDIAARSALVTGLQSLTFPAGPGEACTNLISVNVPAGKRRLVLRTQTQLASGKNDPDALKLRCNP